MLSVEQTSTSSVDLKGAVSQTLRISGRYSTGNFSKTISDNVMQGSIQKMVNLRILRGDNTFLFIQNVYVALHYFHRLNKRPIHI